MKKTTIIAILTFKIFTKGIYYMNIDFIIDAKRENTEIYPYDINFNLFASS